MKWLFICKRYEPCSVRVICLFFFGNFARGRPLCSRFCRKLSLKSIRSITVNLLVFTCLWCISYLECIFFISRELPHCPNLEVSSVYLKKNILQSVRQLFGEKGTESVVDILKYNSKERRFILRCNEDCYVRLRAALTLAQKYEGELCVYRIHRASPNLLSFTANSRTYQHWRAKT